MKKLSVWLFVLLVAPVLFPGNKELSAQKIAGWFLAGDQRESYLVGLDKSIFKTGASSAFIESLEDTVQGFGTIMQTCRANEFLGKRIKMAAYIKTEAVTDWAGMWFRVDSYSFPTEEPLSFDNMADRPIKGNTDWTIYEIIIDVPEESATLNFGVLLSGTGKVWFDNLRIDAVSELAADTGRVVFVNRHPINLDFEGGQ